ncbi:hypothetical protein GLE_4591 [Lysobacter enzymogenes]|uniref:Uncharacterized protein n=1 Tax=Lysobacter enzymogenes TaxID=69 RepID=A0A0S2DN21_LYSEN|nr:hypothetical protein GLE_4591 [Lysobacter enzymogenes]
MRLYGDHARSPDVMPSRKEFAAGCPFRNCRRQRFAGAAPAAHEKTPGARASGVS